MKTAMARLDIEIFVDCPYCDQLIDLLKQDDTGGVFLDSEGYILSQACPVGGGSWMEAHKHFEVDEVSCTRCAHTFSVKELEW